MNYNPIDNAEYDSDCDLDYDPDYNPLAEENNYDNSVEYLEVQPNFINSASNHEIINPSPNLEYIYNETSDTYYISDILNSCEPVVYNNVNSEHPNNNSAIDDNSVVIVDDSEASNDVEDCVPSSVVYNVNQTNNLPKQSIEVRLEHKIKCCMCHKPFLNNKNLSAHIQKCQSGNNENGDSRKSSDTQNYIEHPPDNVTFTKRNPTELSEKKQPPKNLKRCAHDIDNTQKCSVYERLSTEEKELASSSVKPLEYDTCYKQFILNRTLTTHMGTHPRKLAYECDICHQQFAAERNLAIHSHIHKGTYAFHCYICRKPFSYKRNLTEHLRVHTEQSSPYECNICRKLFTHRCSVTMHMRTHAEKPYVCDICHIRFVRKNDFKMHVDKCNKQNRETIML